MFATLDPTSRRLRFPREREVIITDTVGFIRDLPKDLMAAFHATLHAAAPDAPARVIERARERHARYDAAFAAALDHVGSQNTS